MKTHNPENERLKREYFTFLKEARRYSEASLDGVAKALHRFETYTKFKDFKRFHIEQAMGFKRHLAEQVNLRTKQRLSKSTIYSTLMALRSFFLWLAGRPGFRRRLSYADAEYFNPSEKDISVAKAHREQRVATLEQIHHLIKTMPAETDVERRNRALIAFTLLTGARDSAIASMKLKHIDLVEGRVIQDAREVRTKFSKTFTTYFFPLDEEVRRIVVDWVEYLRSKKLWGPDDPLFPATEVTLDANHQFRASGLDRKHWSNAGPILKIFKEAFTRADLPYFNPHSFRNTLAQLGQRRCRTPEQFKAWSQNLGHAKVMTTFTSYGEVAPVRQAEIIRELAHAEEPDAQAVELARQFMQVTRKSQ